MYVSAKLDIASRAQLAARLVARYPDQGWSLLCNGVALLDDGDQLLPDGRIVSPVAGVPVLP